MKVNIVGGGPSGLFLAILLKLRDRSTEVSVFEQNPAGATYGFGVGLADTAIGKLSDADPETLQRLQERMYFISEQVIENCSGAYTVRSRVSNGMITRLHILEILQQRCEELSIPIAFEQRVEDLEALQDADLLVGADGANSTVRQAREADFGTRRDTLGNRFAWFGCAHSRKESGLRFRRIGDAKLIAHYYSYTPDMWTFVGEVDDGSWRALAMDAKSDAQRKALFEEAFADVLDGAGLVENRSLWSRFQTVTNERWSVGNRVLIGDALYRAHFSIGSGTRLAMEDSVGLANALRDCDNDVPAALSRYEEIGKPRKAKLMSACEGSYRWYENCHRKFDLPILEFIYDFMNRTGRMPEDRLRLVVPEFMEAYETRAA